MENTIKTLAIAIQMNHPVIVWHPPGKDCSKIIEKVTAVIECRVLETLDLSDIRNPFILSGRYTQENILPNSYDPEEMTYYRDPSPEDLVAPDWLVSWMKDLSDKKTLLLKNLMLSREDVKTVAIRLMMKDADRFHVPRSLRMVATSPVGSAHFNGISVESNFVQIHLTGDEVVEEKEIPFVLTNWTSFVGRWGVAIGSAIEKDFTLLAGETEKNEETRNRNVRGWDRAIKMIAAAESANSSTETLRLAAESCVGSLANSEWREILRSYGEALEMQEV